MRLSIVLIAGLCLLAGCASRFPSVAVTKEMSDAAKIAILSTLRDPSSAQFGDRFSASAFGSKYHVCGIVNARNGFGGYTGAQVFSTVYDPSTGQATYEHNGGDSRFACALFNANEFSTAVPSAVLAQQGIVIDKPPPAK